MMTPEPDQQDEEQVFPCHGVKGPFQSLHHAFGIILGLAGVTCFSIALVQQRPFDATLAAIVVMLCWYMVFLYTERTKLKTRELHGLPPDLVARGAEQCTSVEDGMCELDLTGYAKTLGVSIGSGTGLEEGGTVSKMMLDALAKEYLRCMSALKCYQQAYGTLPDDSEPDQVAKLPRAQLSLPLELVPGREGCAAPRSRMANPPCPDLNSSQARTEAPSSQPSPEGTIESSSAHEGSYQQSRPEGTSESHGSHEESHQANGPSSLAASRKEESRALTDDIYSHSHLNSRDDKEACPDPCSFGLFGRY